MTTYAYPEIFYNLARSSNIENVLTTNILQSLLILDSLGLDDHIDAIVALYREDAAALSTSLVELKHYDIVSRHPVLLNSLNSARFILLGRDKYAFLLYLLEKDEVLAAAILRDANRLIDMETIAKLREVPAAAKYLPPKQGDVRHRSVSNKDDGCSTY